MPHFARNPFILASRLSAHDDRLTPKGIVRTFSTPNMNLDTTSLASSGETPDPPGAAPTSRLWERVIPTGSLALDRTLGVGGWPRGRIVELYGVSSSGRTTLALEAIAQAQLHGGTGVLLDADHATDPEALARFGIDPDRLTIHRSNLLQDVFEQIEDSLQQGADVIVLDSIAALVRELEPRQRRTDRQEGKDEEHQRLIEHGLKRVLGQLYSSRSVLLIINQLREKVGVMYGN